MVSLHTHLSPSRREGITEELLMENPTKKRKWKESQVEEVLEKPMKTKSIFDMELHLETPLPLEWQRCLDIKSGEIYYCNMRTRKRTSKDPRMINPEPPSPGGHMVSLDLELNLPCGSLTTNNHHNLVNSGSTTTTTIKNFSGGLARPPSWLAFKGDEREMITAVCKKCHLLVMMCKSSPACPNCKFLHPPDQTPPNLLKPRLSLLC